MIDWECLLCLTSIVEEENMLNMTSWYTLFQLSVFLFVTSLLFPLSIQSANSFEPSYTYKPTFEFDRKKAEHCAQLDRNKLEVSTKNYYASCQSIKHQSTVKIYNSTRDTCITTITTPDRVKAITISPDEQLISLACRRKTRYDDNHLQSELLLRTYRVRSPSSCETKIIRTSPLENKFYIEKLEYKSDALLICTYLPYPNKQYLNNWLEMLDGLQFIVSKHQQSGRYTGDTLARIRQLRNELETYTAKPPFQQQSSCIIL